MKITDKHTSNDWHLVALQGNPEGEGYLVKPREGVAHYVRSLDEPRKFGHGQYIPISDHNEVDEDIRNQIFRMVEESEMSRRDA